MIPDLGWKCPCCGRVYNPRQEMCLYCGPDKKGPTLKDLEEWSSTSPFINDTPKEPSNIREVKGTPFYTTTTGSICYDGPIPTVILGSTSHCDAYVNGMCLGTKEPFESDCQGLLSQCTEYNSEKK